MPPRHRRLENALAEFAYQEFASHVLIDPDETIGIVSSKSVRKTRRSPKAGAAVSRQPSSDGERQWFL
ncbi:hypothetical protein [Silicimonas sp. MF1-12-2]|uniref:hypothetical protein n=1 Tax=Silicimonas sp. MF1-12-2 TaxID=3384793 RepID=UPI0039B5180C